MLFPRLKYFNGSPIVFRIKLKHLNTQGSSWYAPAYIFGPVEHSNTFFSLIILDYMHRMFHAPELPLGMLSYPLLFGLAN